MIIMNEVKKRNLIYQYSINLLIYSYPWSILSRIAMLIPTPTNNKHMQKSN